jgi:hypothetical protein
MAKNDKGNSHRRGHTGALALFGLGKSTAWMSAHRWYQADLADSMIGTEWVLLLVRGMLDLECPLLGVKQTSFGVILPGSSPLGRGQTFRQARHRDQLIMRACAEFFCQH